MDSEEPKMHEVVFSDIEIKWSSVILEDCLDYTDVIGYIDSPDDFLAKCQRRFLKKAVTSALKEIQENRTISSLAIVVQNEKQRQQSFLSKKEKLAETLESITRTKNAICRLKKEAEGELDHLDEEELNWQMKLQEVMQVCSQQHAFAENKFQHDVQSCHSKMQHEEACLRQEIKACEHNIEMEFLINDLLEANLKDTKMNLLNEIKNMEKKLEDSRERNASQIQELENELLTLTTKTENLSQKCDLYAETISEDKLQKMMEQQRIEDEIKLNKVIIHLQSWWRGIMVRRGIGAYARRKKKKKAPKKKNAGESDGRFQEKSGKPKQLQTGTLNLNHNKGTKVPLVSNQSAKKSIKGKK